MVNKKYAMGVAEGLSLSNGIIYLPGVEALNIGTVGHELFHQIQYQIDPGNFVSAIMEQLQYDNSKGVNVYDYSHLKNKCGMAKILESSGYHSPATEEVKRKWPW
jgi:hypothetical protein